MFPREFHVERKKFHYKISKLHFDVNEKWVIAECSENHE